MQTSRFGTHPRQPPTDARTPLSSVSTTATPSSPAGARTENSAPGPALSALTRARTPAQLHAGAPMPSRFLLLSLLPVTHNTHAPTHTFTLVFRGQHLVAAPYQAGCQGTEQLGRRLTLGTPGSRTLRLLAPASPRPLRAGELTWPQTAGAQPPTGVLGAGGLASACARVTARLGLARAARAPPHILPPHPPPLTSRSFAPPACPPAWSCRRTRCDVRRILRRLRAELAGTRGEGRRGTCLRGRGG